MATLIGAGSRRKKARKSAATPKAKRKSTGRKAPPAAHRFKKGHKPWNKGKSGYHVERKKKA